MLLEVTFGKLYAWAIQNIRNILLEASVKFKELGKFKDQKLEYIYTQKFGVG